MTKDQIRTAQNTWRLCLEIPLVAYLGNPPHIDKAYNVSRCLFMIAAHESDGFKARRQYGFSPDSMRGAFGLWQCELDGINRAIERMSQRETWLRCMKWLRKEGVEMPMDTKSVLMMLQKAQGDPLACLLARVFHLGVRDEIPSDLVEMSEYCKRFHNTFAGSATPENYLNAYNKWITVAMESS